MLTDDESAGRDADSCTHLCSRPPPLGRPAASLRDRLRRTRRDVHSPGSGACEQDGADQSDHACRRSDNCLAPEHADHVSNELRAGPSAATRSADALTSSDAANLGKVDHVVVVMLENRSFDHMLGYLSLTGRRPEIDGLRPEMANQYQGRTYPVHHLGATALEMDPDHSAGAIDRQIAGRDMSGFVASAAATLAARGVQDGDPGCVMGYYDDADVPVYDHLAEGFAVCDRWFASVPGATLPNRLYALCGAAAGSRDDRPSYVPPLYHQPSFVRHLDAHRISWR